MFDIGCMQLNPNEIMLFGGFHEGPLDKVYIFKSTESEFEEAEPLPKPDFFIMNGQFIEIPPMLSHSGNPSRLVIGHSSAHVLDMP